jgi:hypothetical protein
MWLSLRLLSSHRLTYRSSQQRYREKQRKIVTDLQDELQSLRKQRCCDRTVPQILELIEHNGILEAENARLKATLKVLGRILEQESSSETETGISTLGSQPVSFLSRAATT